MHDSFEIGSPSAWGLELSRMLKYDNGLTNLMICPIPAPDLLVAHDAPVPLFIFGSFYPLTTQHQPKSPFLQPWKSISHVMRRMKRRW